MPAKRSGPRSKKRAGSLKIGTWSPKALLVAQGIADGLSLEEAAAGAKVTLRTARDYAQRDGWRELVSDMLRGGAVDAINQILPQSLRRLYEIIQHGDDLVAAKAAGLAFQLAERHGALKPEDAALPPADVSAEAEASEPGRLRISATIQAVRSAPAGETGCGWSDEE